MHRNMKLLNVFLFVIGQPNWSETKNIDVVNKTKPSHAWLVATRCGLCSLSGKDLAVDEETRLKIRELSKEIESLEICNPVEALKKAESKLELMENIRDRVILRFIFQNCIFQICISHILHNIFICISSKGFPITCSPVTSLPSWSTARSKWQSSGKRFSSWLSLSDITITDIMLIWWIEIQISSCSNELLNASWDEYVWFHSALIYHKLHAMWTMGIHMGTKVGASLEIWICNQRALCTRTVCIRS